MRSTSLMEMTSIMILSDHLTWTQFFQVVGASTIGYGLVWVAHSVIKKLDRVVGWPRRQNGRRRGRS
jgi:hypothetical protein